MLLSHVAHSLQTHGLYISWNSPGQNTGVGSLSLLQGIFPIQGSNPGQTLYPLSHQGSPLTPTRKQLNIHTKPTDSMTESPQAKQRTGKEHSPTHQQTTGFFTEHGPAHQGKSQFSPQPVLPSHQEACTSLLHSSTRGQTEEARTIIPQPQKLQSQKANQNEKKLDYVPDEGTR